MSNRGNLFRFPIGYIFLVNESPVALAVLSALITPAVLISACGSLILATAQRLNRIIDRTRNLAAKMNEFPEDAPETPEETLTLMLLKRAAHRTRLLQGSMFSLYLALSVFVADSLVLGIVSAYARENMRLAGFPIVVGLFGTALMFAGTLFLIVESRLALRSVQEEMDFVLNSRARRRMGMP